VSAWASWRSRLRAKAVWADLVAPLGQEIHLLVGKDGEVRFISTALGGRHATILDDVIQISKFSRLLDKQLIQLAGQLPSGKLASQHTPLGRVVAQLVKENLGKRGKKTRN